MADNIKLSNQQIVIAEDDTEYQILQKLGSGGNAHTYLVVATSGRQHGVFYALKIFYHISKPERKEQFIEEVEFLKENHHHGIMQVFNSGTYQEKYPFLIAEYLPQTLHAVIRANQSSMVEKIAYIFQLLSVFDYLSKLAPPVIHRDIKPRNIFVKGKSCILGDFGLMKKESAREMNESQEKDDIEAIKKSMGVGMPKSHRSPDLVAYLNGDGYPTCKSDLFQLGLVATELFTGVNPLQKAASCESPVVLMNLPNILAGMGEMIVPELKKMLVFNPSERVDAFNLLKGWRHIFEEAVKRSFSLEGRIF